MRVYMILVHKRNDTHSLTRTHARIQVDLLGNGVEFRLSVSFEQEDGRPHTITVHHDITLWGGYG